MRLKRKRRPCRFFTAKKLSRTYDRAVGQVEALASLDLTVALGERIGVVGPSGSGKSTLLSLLAGRDRPTTGEIIVDSQPLTQLWSNATRSS